MKIAVWHNLPSGGGKRALFHHVKGLLERGHQIESWCPPTADREYLPLRDLIPEHVLPLALEGDRTRVAEQSALSTLSSMRKRLRAMDEHCKHCGEEIARGGFDVLFANSCAMFGASSIARHTNLPSALYLQEPHRILYEALPTLPWCAPAQSDGPWSPRKLKHALGDIVRVQALRLQAREETLNAGRFDRILVNSLFSRESLLRAYGLESEVCYLGINEKLFFPTGESKENYLVGLGSFSFGKDPERSIRAVGAIPSEKRPEIVWIGNFAEPSYAKEMQELADRSGVVLKIKVRIGDDEIRSLLSRAALLIYTPRLEPFGYAPLEANACGTPVVAIAEGGIRETVEDGINGLLVDRSDPAILADAVLRLINDGALAARLGQDGLSLVKRKWSLSEATNRIEGKLLNLVREKALV